MGLLPTKRIQVRGTLPAMPYFNRVNSNTHLPAQNPQGPVHAILTGREQSMQDTQPACLASERLQKSVGPSLMARNSYNGSQDNRLSEADDLTSVRGSSKVAADLFPLRSNTKQNGLETRTHSSPRQYKQKLHQYTTQCLKAISIQSHTLNSEVSKLGCWKQVEEKKREGNQSLWNRARKKQRPLRLREKTMIQVAKGTGAGNCFNTAAQSERRRRMGWLVLPFTDSMNHMPKEHTAAHPPWAMLWDKPSQVLATTDRYRSIQSDILLFNMPVYKHAIQYSCQHFIASTVIQLFFWNVSNQKSKWL